MYNILSNRVLSYLQNDFKCRSNIIIISYIKHIFHDLLDPIHIPVLLKCFVLRKNILCSYVSFKCLEADGLSHPTLTKYFSCIESSFIYSYSYFQTQYNYQENGNSFLIMSITHKYLCSLKALELPTSVGWKSCSQKFSGSVTLYPYIIMIVTDIHLYVWNWSSKHEDGKPTIIDDVI